MRRRIALGLLAVLALTACGNPSMTPEGPDLKVAFTSSPERTDKLLNWTYTLRNDEAVPIAVFNGSWGDFPPEKLGGTWSVGRDRDTVEVSQRLFAPPDGVGLARDYTQYGTILQPGDQLDSSGAISLPLELRHPYEEAFDPPLTFPKDPDEAIFCVGVARVSDIGPDRPVEPVMLGTPPLFRHSQWTQDHETLLCAPPVSLR